jgi:hypothetical protein
LKLNDLKAEKREAAIGFREERKNKTFNKIFVERKKNAD